MPPDRDAEVETVYVVAGDRVQAKELLVVLRAVGGLRGLALEENKLRGSREQCYSF